jgi:hypothetical protein
MNIGETITVRALSSLWANRKAYAYPIAQYQSFTGTVLPNPSWVGADRICIGTGDVAFPFRVIEKSAIEGYSQVSVAPADLQRTWSVPGANPNQSYLVTREGARWGCNCVGFGYRRTCTHVTTAKAQFEGVAVPSKQKREKSQHSNKLPVDLIPQIPYPKNRLKLKRALPPTFENGVYTMAKQYTGTNRAKVAAIMADHPDHSREACIALISQLGSMPYETAKAGYQRAVRLGIAPGQGKSAAAPKAAKPTKGSLEKPVRAINAKQKAKTAAQHLGLADSAEAIAKVKEANLQRMREVSAKLKPKGKVRDFGGRVANVEPEGVHDYDPTLAREEVNSILRDERLIDVCPKFVREDA